MNTSKSLDELEIYNLPNSGLDSNLVTECSRLFKLPLSKLSVENLRLLIGQGIGLEHLMPIALSKLEENPLTESNLYAGGLLASVIKLPEDFWVKYPDYNNRLVEIKLSVEDIADTLNNEILPKLNSLKFS